MTIPLLILILGGAMIYIALSNLQVINKPATATNTN